jgi:uncharacterized protein DUF6781
MTTRSTHKASDARLEEAVADAVRQGAGIREKVQEITLDALQGQRFDSNRIREVVRAVTEGAVQGTGRSGAQMRESMSEVLRGLSQALRVSSEAGSAKLKDLTAAGRSFSDQDLKVALASLRKLEDDFLDTVTQVGNAANSKMGPELREAFRTARETSTTTGRDVAAAMGDFSQKFAAASFDAALFGLERANEFGQRFAMVASGVLGGLAEALRAPADEKGADKTGGK